MTTTEANTTDGAAEFATGDDDLDSLLQTMSVLNDAVRLRLNAMNTVTRRILRYRNLQWLSQRMGEKMRGVYESAPTTSDDPDNAGERSKINLTEFSADNAPSFVLNFSEDNKRAIAGYDVKRLFRMAARLFHSDVAGDTPENAQRFRLAKALRDSGDGEGLALLCLHGGMKLDVDYTNLLRERIAAARKYYDALEHTVGFYILQRVNVGWTTYDAGLNGYLKALAVMGDHGAQDAYESQFGPLLESYGPDAALKHEIR